MAHMLQTYIVLSGPALVHSDSPTLPAAQTSNAATPFRKMPRRCPRTPFAIFRDVFMATNKNALPRRQIEVNAIAGPVWHGLSEKDQFVYQTLARLERETYERDHPTHALQRRGSGGGKGSKNNRGCRKIPSRAADEPRTEAQYIHCHTPAPAPAVVPKISRIQDAPFTVNTDEMLSDVYATQGQSIVNAQHRYAATNMQISYQWSPSTSVAATSADHSDPQVHNHAARYYDVSGQTFTTLKPTAILQDLAPVPTVAPTDHGPNLLTTTSYHPLDPNADDALKPSPASSMEVGPFTGEREPYLYYERPVHNTWENQQYRRR